MTNNPNFKKVIALAISLAMLFIIYYGTYLPLRKSYLFIFTMNSLNQTASIEEFKSRISTPLDAPSPYGQEELVRQVGTVISNVIRQEQAPAEIVNDLVSFLRGYYAPIINKGNGTSFNQNLYLLGTLNEIAFIKTGNPQYLEEAKSYILRSYELGPKRPQALYGLLDVYRLEGNWDKAKKVSEEILTYWPNDEKVQGVYSQILENLTNSQ